MTALHVGDYGTVLRLTLTENGAVVDISGATTKQIKLRTPDDRILTKPAVFTAGGTDGAFQYTLQAGDLNTPGQWRWQGYLVGIGGWAGHTSEGTPFTVKEPVT